MRKYNADPERRQKKIEKDRRRWAAKRAALNSQRREKRKSDPAIARARAREHYRRSREKILAQLKASYARRLAKSPDAMRAVTAVAARRRYATNDTKRVNARMSARVRQSLKGEKLRRSWQTLVGYTLEELEARLRATIPPGYTWDDFLSADLEIDHIRPVASFSFSSAEDPSFRECWALRNLQLLPPLENNRKNATWSPAAARIAA